MIKLFCIRTQSNVFKLRFFIIDYERMSSNLSLFQSLQRDTVDIFHGLNRGYFFEHDVENVSKCFKLTKTSQTSKIEKTLTQLNLLLFPFFSRVLFLFSYFSVIVIHSKYKVVVGKATLEKCKANKNGSNCYCSRRCR